MLRKILVGAAILLLLITGFIHFMTQPPVTSLIDRDEQLPQVSQLTVAPEIDQLNSANQLISTFQCQDVEIKIWQNGNRLRLKGTIHYVKPNKFRMEISSVLGKELDLGSNEEHFWYWSHRDKRPGLYYARYEDYFKTRLKTPFNPMFMKATLGVDEIPLTGTTVQENDQDFAVVSDQRDSLGRPIQHKIFVDKITNQISGFLVTGRDGSPLVAAEILARKNGLASKILYHWYEEDRMMQLELKDATINKSISAMKFEMPEYKPKINMAEE